MTLKCYSPGNKPLGFLHNVFDLKITKEIGGMEELTFFIPANSPEAQMVQLEGYIVPEGEQIFVIRELNTHGKDIEVYCMLAIETLYGYCWSEVAKQKVNLIEAFEYVLKYTGWKFVNRTSTPARTRDIYIQNQTVWEALKVLCEVYFIEMTVDTHTHTITAYDSVGQDNGVFFISDMNLVNFRKDTNTHKLITRLIPIGKDGLNITSVNGGKDYIDNNTYSDKLLYGLWMQSAYTNPTQLKEDATKWLAEYAKPYITYNIDIIDLYRLNGNQLFKFNVGDGVTIFDKVTEEKVSQRVVKIEIYPQDPTRNTLELSNKGKTFSDYFQMIQLMQNMANHFIQTNGSATGTGGTNGSSNPNLKDDIINGDHIQSDSIGTDHLQSDSITTDKLTANSITTDKLVANSITTDKLTANSITSDKIQANSIKTEHLQANIIDANKIHAGAITTDKLQAGSVTADKIASNSITTDKLTANSITSDKIQANNIEAKHIKAGTITADKIGAGAIETDHLQAGVIDSIHIKSDSITAEHLQAGSIVAGSTVIANGAIGDAQISSVNANKINAGEIDTSKVKVKGSNGYLFIENNTLFVVDNKKQIRCELGVIENNSNYGFIVRGSDGQTILIDHNGVHNAGITDGAIDNRKVSENANISGKKLDIDSVIRTINDDGSVTIEGTKIQVGNTTLDVELSKQTNLINDHTTQLSTHQSSIKANTDAIKLKVDSQTYTQDKNTMTSKIEKNTSAIDILEKEIDLKVSATDVEEIVGDVTTTKINEAVSQINITTNAISQKVSNVETVTNTLDGKIKSHETRIANAESKITDSAITNVVKQAQFIKDIEGNITEVESAISSVEQTANSITSKVNGLDGKYTEIKQTVDKIDLTGKVSFSDLSTAGKTTINGSNITTGTLSADRVLGGTLKGVSLQTYSGTNTSGVRIHPGGMQLNDTSFFYNNEGKFELQCKQGVAFSSQKDIHIMPGLLASGTPSGSGTVVIPSATLRTQKLYVVNNATFESGLSTTSISASSTIKGRNYITLDRGSVYIPRLNSSITTDYLRLGGAYISGADSGAIHFNYSSSRSGALGRGTVYLPSGGGNNTTDHLAFHSGIIACVDSGNFHFVTAGGGNATIYPKGVVATYSLDNVARTRTTSKALDIISSVPVTQTVEGFRLDVPKARTTENEHLITTSENEQTGELDISTNYNSMLGTMWKAIQELQQEVKELKKENEELRTLLNKGE